jgi:hypothetical protein
VLLKLKVLEIYNHRLDERERRKKFILQQVRQEHATLNLDRPFSKAQFVIRRIPLGGRFDRLGACLLVCHRPVIG